MDHRASGRYVPTWKLNLRGLRSKSGSGVLSPGNELDLSHVNFITPGGLVGLACLLEAWTAEHGAVSLVTPNDLGVVGYMHRMDFFKHLEGKISPDKNLSYLDSRGRYPASLSELRRVGSREDADEVSAQFFEILSEDGLREAEVDRCCKVLTESLNNVLDHADSSCGAYTAIQKWPKTDTVVVAVADAGVGIPHTIRDHPRVQRVGRTDEALIKLAAEDKVSRERVQGRGGGLTSALTSVGNGCGRLMIWSGRGWVEFSGLGRIEAEELVQAFEGTCVEAEFPLNGARV